MDDAIRLTVLRHGEVEGKKHVFRGKSDPALSAAGWAQMKEIDFGSLDSVASSPLRRCRDFAGFLASSKNIPLAVYEGFCEMDFGCWEGLDRDEAALYHPDSFAVFENDTGKFCAPGGESYCAFRDRVVESFDEWIEKGSGRDRLLITHGGVMKVLLCHLLSIAVSSSQRIFLPSAARFEVSLKKGFPPFLLSLN